MEYNETKWNELTDDESTWPEDKSWCFIKLYDGTQPKIAIQTDMKDGMFRNCFTGYEWSDVSHWKPLNALSTFLNGMKDDFYVQELKDKFNANGCNNDLPSREQLCWIKLKGSLNFQPLPYWFEYDDDYNEELFIQVESCGIEYKISQVAEWVPINPPTEELLPAAMPERLERQISNVEQEEIKFYHPYTEEELKSRGWCIGKSLIGHCENDNITVSINDESTIFISMSPNYWDVPIQMKDFKSAFEIAEALIKGVCPYVE